MNPNLNALSFALVKGGESPCIKPRTIKDGESSCIKPRTVKGGESPCITICGYIICEIWKTVKLV